MSAVGRACVSGVNARRAGGRARARRTAREHDHAHAVVRDERRLWEATVPRQDVDVVPVVTTDAELLRLLDHLLLHLGDRVDACERVDQLELSLGARLALQFLDEPLQKLAVARVADAELDIDARLVLRVLPQPILRLPDPDVALGQVALGRLILPRLTVLLRVSAAVLRVCLHFVVRALSALVVRV